jgi:hypothetical protein
MAITKISNSSLKNLNKYDSFLAGNAAYDPSATFLIQRYTIGGTAVSSIDFTSIPTTYKHLQIRLIGRSNVGTSGNDNYWVSFNGDTASNYSNHYMYGTGSAASSGVATSATSILMARTPGATATANVFGAAIMDILDYQSTNKNKTIRSLTGSDFNGSGDIFFFSGSWMNTAAITSIKIQGMAGGTNATNSTFALYGIKG